MGKKPLRIALVLVALMTELGLAIEVKGNGAPTVTPPSVYTRNIESASYVSKLASRSRNANEIYVQDGETSLDLLLYDNFNNAIYDGAYNPTLWYFTGADFYEVRQENGNMVFSNSTSPSVAGGDLVMLQPASRTLEQIQEYEADLKISSDHSGGYAFVKIQIMASGIAEGDWWTQCRLGSWSGSNPPEYVCDVYTYVNGNFFREYETTPIVLSFDTWYTAKIEVDPKTAHLYYYLNGNLVGGRIPNNASELMVATNLEPRIGVWNDSSNTYATRHIDNVRITDASMPTQTPVLIDDFNDNSTNSSLWWAYEDVTGLSVAEINQRLEIAIPKDSSGDVFGAGYISIFSLRGDFDVEAEYYLLNWPTQSGVRVGLASLPPNYYESVQRTGFGGDSDFPGFPREVYLTDFREDVQGITATTDLAGKLRIIRTGNVWTSYYFDASSGFWVAIYSAYTSTDDVPISLSSWSHDYAFGDSDVLIAFDNFVVNRGEVIYPAPPPIVLLPGIMGSRLQNSPIDSLQCLGRYQGEVWPNIIGLLTDLPHYNPALSSLWLNSDGSTPENSCDIISPSGIVGKVFDDYYDHFISEMEDKYSYEVTAFPYDWRLDINDIVFDLNTFISTNFPNEKVILVGHSMGGWVARQFIADPTRAEKIARVITVGTPYWGAPKIAMHMRSGTAPVGFLNALVSNDVLWELIKDSTGAMQILPAEGYFEQFDTVGEGRGYYINGNDMLDTYEQTTQFFVVGNPALPQNSYLIAKGRDFHRTIDHFPDNLSVPYHILAANHTQTIGTIREYPCRFGWRHVCVRPLHYTLGDGTAPFDSARLWGVVGDWSGGADVCTYNRASASKEHSQMLADDNIIADINQIIRGEPPLHCLLNYGSSAQGGSLADKSEIVQEDLSYLEIVVWGNHRVKIQDDSGNVAGYNEDGLIENQIPYASYDLIGNGTIVVVPADNNYQLSIELMDDSPFNLEISDLVSVTPSNISPLQKASFLDIDSTDGGIVTMQIVLPVELSALELDHDIDNDGDVDRSYTPTLLLNQDQINDLTPPTTTIAIQGDKNYLGFYEGQVRVTLSAVDDETGVFKTEYSTDGGKIWNAYTQPLDILVEEVPVFYARSVDLAGNEEFPWLNARLLAYTIYLPYADR